MGSSTEPKRSYHSLAINFKQNTAEQQAKTILNYVSTLRQERHHLVGLTYSANLTQTTQIEKAHQEEFSGAAYVSGENQAGVVRVINDLLKLEEYSHLQNVFRILPIPTMQYTYFRSMTPRAKQVSDDELSTRLDKIEQFAQEGNTVIVWGNQTDQIAIGG